MLQMNELEGNERGWIGIGIATYNASMDCRRVWKGGGEGEEGGSLSWF